MGVVAIVCGGRDFTDRRALIATLDALHSFDPFSLIVEGGQRTRDRVTRQIVGGADYWAMRWARERGVPWTTVEADWYAHGRSAGHIRNGEMIANYYPDLVVAFPGGPGTADMVRQARAKRIHVIEPKIRGELSVSK